MKNQSLFNDANMKRLHHFSNPTEKAQHDKLVALVESMLERHKKHHEARMDRDKKLYERQITIVDAQIDMRVYELYGLTEEVVKVVEKREDGSWRKSINEQRKNNKTNAINRSKNVGQAIYRVYVTGWKKRFKK